MYYLNILYCNVLSEDSCPASGRAHSRGQSSHPVVLLLYETPACKARRLKKAIPKTKGGGWRWVWSVGCPEIYIYNSNLDYG